VERGKEVERGVEQEEGEEGNPFTDFGERPVELEPALAPSAEGEVDETRMKIGKRGDIETAGHRAEEPVAATSTEGEAVEREVEWELGIMVGEGRLQWRFVCPKTQQRRHLMGSQQRSSLWSRTRHLWPHRHRLW